MEQEQQSNPLGRLSTVETRSVSKPTWFPKLLNFKETDREMRAAFLIGRVGVSLFYLYTGIDNLLNASDKVGYAMSKGVPVPQLLIPFSGLLLLVAGLSLLLGFQVHIAVGALVLFFIPVTLTMHNFWMIQDPIMRTVELHNFQGNFGLLASAFLFMGIPTPWPFSLDTKFRELI